MPFDAEAARRYLISDDRDVAPFFAGRTEEIRHFREALSMLGDGRDAALFRIFQGAPGVGKTSLLNHLRANGPEDAAFLPLRTDDLTSKATLDAGVRRGLDAALGGNIRGMAEAGRSLAKSFKFDGVVDAGRKALVERVGRTKRIVLYMDEAQLVEPNCRTGLTELHTRGLGFPSLVLLVGLSHTKRCLAAAGLSRLSSRAVRMLGGLSDDECERSTLDMLAAFGANGDAERAAEEIAKLSFGWPQHLFGAQQALCAELLEREGELGRVEWDAVRAESDRVRFEYYQGRLSGSPLEENVLATARIVAAVSAGGVRNPSDLRKICAEEVRRAGMAGDPELADGKAFRQALIEKGVVTVAEDGGCSLTIPSMADWMAGFLPKRA